MRTILISILILFPLNTVFSQKSISYAEKMRLFEMGKQHYTEHQYAPAKDYLTQFVKDMPESEGKLIEAKYYIATSNLFLKEKNAETELTIFINRYSESYFANQGVFVLANHKYFQGNYRYALTLYKKCKPHQLNKEQLNEFKFKKGYCHFTQKEWNDAEELFYQVKNEKGLYRDAATYYYAHIQYEEKNYTTALDEFLKLENNQQYMEVVPYYLTQLYHEQKNYEKVLEYGPKLLTGAANSRTGEIARIVGDAWYARKDYANAVKYLERYMEETPKLQRPDVYHLAVAYYNLKNYTKAVETFSQVATAEDELSQSAYGYLGDSYLKLDDKNRARMAFEAASRMTFDKKLQEESLYNFARLTYELSFSPFNETITAFERFLELFPQSKYRDEVYDLLANVFMTTQNYERAYQSILKINSRDVKVLKALQRVTYYRGIELLTDNRPTDAVKYLGISIENSRFDPEIKALAYYWRGESYYRLEQFENALSDFNQFILMPGSFSQSVFAMAHYNMGYCYFKQKNYSGSINWFRKYVTLNKSGDKHLITDANNRIGDCYYLKRDFTTAISFYGDGLRAGGAGADYALFKKAFCHGLDKANNLKISELRKLITQFPESRYTDDAWFELGKAWVAENNLQQAINSYNTIVTNFATSTYKPKALLNMALAYYNLQNIDKASELYKSVVQNYGGTDDAKVALNALKNISVEKNNVAEYIDYTKEVGGFATLNVTQEDSLTYSAAEKLYMSGNITDSKRYFSDYMQKFPQGAFLTQAHYYKADCHLRAQEIDEAIADLQYVVSRPRSQFSEEALAVLADLMMQRNQSAQALEYYTQLLAQAEQKANIKTAKTGIMRCQFDLKNAGATIVAADDLLKELNVEPELQREANYKKAKSFMMLDNEAGAAELFAVIAKDTRSKEGAEAKYMVAYLANKQGNDALAEKEIFSFISMNTPHQFWLAKAFILLSEIYTARNDDFQAKQYLLSVKENYPYDDEIKVEVAHKLLQLEQRELQRQLEKRDTLKTYFRKADSLERINNSPVQ